MAYLPVVVAPPRWARMRPGAVKVRELPIFDGPFVHRTRSGERIPRCGAPLYLSYSGARRYALKHLLPKPRKETE